MAGPYHRGESNRAGTNPPSQLVPERARARPVTTLRSTSTHTVHGCYGSSCTQQVYLTLAEKGVVANRRMINIGPPKENYEPRSARLNPGLVAPTLEHGGRYICNSSTIIRYIDESFSGPRLVAESAPEREQVEQWIAQIDNLRIREMSYGRLRGLVGRLRDRFIMPRRLSVLRGR